MQKQSILLIFMLWSTVLFGQSPHGKSFEIDCSYCHTTAGWKVDLKAIKFDHDSTDYKLAGQHRLVSCRSCHKSLEFATAKKECKDCHKDLHETTLGPDCAKCHTPKSWIVENISEIHRKSRFPLTGAHQITECSACHKSGSLRRYEPVGIDCIGCHRSTYLATTKPNHQQAGYSTNCIQCHSASAAGWDAINIEHGFFPLTGGHAISCTLCHVTGEYAKIPKDCYSCHKTDFDATTTPNHQQINLSTNCLDCHTTNPEWKPAKFTEHDSKYFPVYTGKHANTWTNCSECHQQKGNYTVYTCVDCHEHAKTKMDDEHKEANGYQYNSIACFTCHPTGNKEGGFNHARTNFPLTGAHTGTDCLDCHANGYKGTAGDCNSCHKNKFDQAKAPDHLKAGIPTLCEPCHTTTSWKPSTFNHLSTGYELAGGHSRVQQCSDCHKGTVVNTKTDCISCHQVQYDNASNHKAQAYPVDCGVCHKPDGWKDISFDHRQTRFPLSGAHVVSECVNCHTTGFAGTPSDCNSCHGISYTVAQNPNHAAAGLPKVCEPCHNTTSWKPSTFNHVSTGLELIGGHARVVQCSDCHRGSVVNTRADCISCHQVQYDKAKDHKSKSYPVDCKLCHNPSSWQGVTFDHAQTRFPLTGVHLVTECATCHTNGYAGTPMQCVSCHNKNFTAAQNPNHTNAGIPEICENCHNATAWKPSTFNHASTGFALTGGHARFTQCSDCHKGTLQNTKTDCIECHRVQYDNAKDHKAQGYPVDCKICHNSDNWSNPNFDHARTSFPLTGSHTTTECAKCHVNGYAGTPAECNSCHAGNFAGAQNPNHENAGIPKTCETCHNTTAWKPSGFNHLTTGFALTNGHSRVLQCSDCHKGTVVNTRTECIACHQVQYDNAKDHKVKVFPQDCRMCHNADNWLNAAFNHSLTSFPLTGSHTTTECARCHTNGFAGTPADCNSCHAGNFAGAQNPNHTNAGIPKLCETCHNTTAWKPSGFNHSTTGFELTNGHSRVLQCSDCHKGTVVNTRTECIACHQVQYDNAKDHRVQVFPQDCRMCHNSDNWLNAAFNHSTTHFPLTGKHATALCSGCHAAGYTGTKTECGSCHSTAYIGALSPDHTAAGLPVVCENCHNTTSWKPSSFNHAATGFALTNGHSTIAQCSACHKGTVLNTRTECIACHQVQYDNAKDHKAQVYPTDCKMCHNSNNWLNASFNHSLTAFPLTGVHQTTLCAKCHTNGYAGTKTDCNSCHTARYTASVNPNHATAGIPTLCETCHNTSAWKPSTFNHTTTGFALTNGHSTIAQCSACHKGTVLNTRTECIACHQVQYDNAKDHKAQVYPTDCKMCHNSNNWLNASFNHSTTTFPLTGVHQTTLCAKCHTNGYTGTKTDCNSCHTARYTASVNPNHATAGIPTLCETCHNTLAWKPSTFNHTTTGFALTGGHTAIAQCSACHKGTVLNTRTECIACHQVQYDNAKDHKAQVYPTDCKMCHNSNNWLNASFNHSLTAFPLTGVHQTTLCAKCHTNGYTGTKKDCNSCHAAKYTASVSPNHATAGIPTLCETCHNTLAWKPSTFNHTTTGFALTGGHTAIAQCSACHKGTVLNTRTECIACHQVQYDNAKDHKAQVYPTDCKMCHNSNNWLNASFNHSQTAFPLAGVHQTTLCAKCHTNGYTGTKTDCNSCHTARYTASVNPNHATAGIPTLCETCHNTSAWKPSTFNHTTTGFALTGGHTAIAQCSACHKGTVLNTRTECIACHQVQYDNAKDHKAQVYPTDCKMCHNSNNWLNASFNHSLTAFPLTGVHQTTLCAKCHTNGYTGTKTDCNSCHTARYTSSVNPNHATAGIPTLCETCHNTLAWKPSTFNHTTTGFALTGGHTAIAQCSACHKGTVLNTRTECIACHQVQYDNAKDHKAQVYPTDCKMCHNSNNWLNASFNHSLTAFPLTGVHQTTLCAKCHTNGYTGTKTDCNSCHTARYTASVNPNHATAGIPTLCETCHNTLAWKPSTFNHTTTGFALTGGHTAIAQCSACHKGTVLNTRTECIACHQVQYDNAKDHKAQVYPTDCKMCHNSNNWLNASFNHSLTAFPLTGVHQTTLCVKCHTNGYTGTKTDCNSCHTARYTSSVNPNHATAGIPTLCETCHNTSAWKPSTFNHTTTGFALTGGHLVIVQCSDCHKGTVLNTRTECIACHQVQYDNAKDHKAQVYPTDCKMCHNSNNWLNASFNHSLTAFPLTGVHQATLCAKCHINGYTGTKTDCNSCHTAKYTASVSPNHTTAGIPTLCETCHNTLAWKPSTFNHTTTGFALTGGHTAIAQCSACHKGTVLNTRTECIACHQVQYDNAKDHKAQVYPTDCKMCHNSNNWLNASFNHSTTAFPLTGVHQTTLCAKCHTNGFSGTPTDCNSCHASKFSAALNPNHATAGIPRLCETCHNTTAWKPSTFNHTTTGFALTGGHLVIVQCSDCHKGTVLNTRTECIACHQVQYDNAKNHKAQVYPTDCKMCHNSNNWLNASFNHSTTAFPLTGVHATTLCSKCHATGYVNTPTACLSCHQANYNEAVNPNHKSLGLPVTCGDCHTTSAGWMPATFPIHSNYFILSGSHSAIASNCALCHKGNYTTTPNTCFGCHAAKYNATTNPNHLAAQFPRECETCHTVTAWTPSTFNHDSQYFPIYSGKHKDKWTLCSECHTTATNYAVFNCLLCHEHSNKTKVDEDHKDVNGYSYTSSACYSCHPRGNSL